MTPTSQVHRIVGTAGHIDHGKSALVQALTGVDPDRLEEEKRRGITIDLGFADLTLDGLHVGFVDVPGHERFVKNMLAGIGGIDAVVLVVAADESVMPQTREHFAICRLLGIAHGVVAITKCDLVDDEIADLVELEVGDLLAGSALAEAPVVRTSATDGTGLETLREVLREVLMRARPRDDAALARLPIDRAFSMRGFGTVVTGTLGQGTVRQGQTLELLPAGLEVSVRGIQVHGATTTSAHGGQRVALNLHGISLDQVERGAVLCESGALSASYLIDAEVTTLPDWPLLDRQRVRFHHGAAEVLARVAVLESSTWRDRGGRPKRGVPAGTSAIVQLRLESPYPMVPGDRFVLRRYSPVITMGGGRVIDSMPPKRRRSGVSVEAIRTLDGASASQRLVEWVAAGQSHGVAATLACQRLGQGSAAFDAVLEQTVAAGDVVSLAGSPRRLVATPIHRAVGRGVETALAEFHTRYPLRPGMPKEDLFAALDGVPARPLFDDVVSDAVGRGRITSSEHGLALSTHEVLVENELGALRDAIVAGFAAGGLAPEAANVVLDGVEAPEGHRREIFEHLLREGTLVRIRDEYVVEAGAVEDLVTTLRARVPAGEGFSVSDLKQWTDLTRRYSIPLLEYLDSKRVTRRAGDNRLLL